LGLGCRGGENMGVGMSLKLNLGIVTAVANGGDMTIAFK
jgi:hypothetical protein